MIRIFFGLAAVVALVFDIALEPLLLLVVVSVLVRFLLADDLLLCVLGLALVPFALEAFTFVAVALGVVALVLLRVWCGWLGMVAWLEENCSRPPFCRSVASNKPLLLVRPSLLSASACSDDDKSTSFAAACSILSSTSEQEERLDSAIFAGTVCYQMFQ